MAVYVLADDMTQVFRAVPKDRLGQPTAFDGPPAWASSDPAVFSVTPLAGDPYQARVMPVAVGTAQLTCTGDADRGAGARPLVATQEIQIVAGDAVTTAIEPGGAPEPLVGP